MKIVVIALAADLIAASLATAANADPPRNKVPMVTEQVSYADLDLASAAGQKRLKDRISFAAYRLCLVDMPASPSPPIADPICFRNAVNGASAQMQRAVARASSGSAATEARH